MQILLRSAAPFTKGDGNNGSDEIITYENSPYIEALWMAYLELRLAGISDFNAAINFMDQAPFVKVGPTYYNSALTITDLYNALYGPTKNIHMRQWFSINNFLKIMTLDPAVHKIDEKARFMFMPDGGALEDLI